MTRGRAGFTLVELLLVLVVVGALLLLALPDLAATLSSERLPTSARDLRSLLQMCRGHAMTSGLRVRVRFPTDEEAAELPQGYQPIVEIEADPIEQPGVFTPLAVGWASEPVFRKGVRFLRLQFGKPQFREDDEDPFGFEEQRLRRNVPEEELYFRTIVFEPDGAFPWVTIQLTDAPPDAEEDEIEEGYQRLNLVMDGTTGEGWIQQPLTEEEIELLKEHNGSPLLRYDRYNAPPLTEDNLLYIDEILKTPQLPRGLMP